jgi:predicted Zn-dependent protease
MSKLFALVLLMVVAGYQDVSAQQPKEKPPVVANDGEIDQFLNRYFLEPLYKAAGWPVTKVKTYLVVIPDVGVFVMSREQLFFSAGAVIDARSPNELMGLFAHEIGHVMSKHMASLRSKASQHAKQGNAGLAVAMVGAGVLATATDEKKQELFRSLLSERLAQEAAADQAAVRLLEKAGMSAKGLQSVVEHYRLQEYVADRFQDAYMRAHPSSVNRAQKMKLEVEGSKFKDASDDPELVAKFAAFKKKVESWGSLR